MTEWMDELTRQAVRTRLLAWSETGLRSLPWRSERTPYRVWVSEVMLQQTQVETVIPYYERWMERFPTIESLAQADLQDVLKCWEGLGYYARCRNLHRAAQIVIERHGGQLPADREVLLLLPGIGEYTAGAILSLAFGRDEAVLDGNVRRVLSRLLALADDPRAAATRRLLWQAVRELLPPGRAGDFNEALMDLGSTVCLPRTPRCGLCPLRELCQGYATDDPDAFPPPLRRAAIPHRTVTAGVIWRGEHLLIAQRPLDGLLGGLWEFPGGKLDPGETLPECLRRELSEEMDIEVAVGDELAVIDHTFTHFSLTLHAFECQYLSAGNPQTIGVRDWRWVAVNELERFAFPVMDQKIVQVLRRRQNGGLA